MHGAEILNQFNHEPFVVYPSSFQICLYSHWTTLYTTKILCLKTIYEARELCKYIFELLQVTDHPLT